MNVYEIIPGKLWQSGILGEYQAPAVDAIVDCTHDMDLKGMAKPLYIHVPFDDRPLEFPRDAELIERLKRVARLAAETIAAGSRFLVHCTAGINRSSLMDGMIILDLAAMGFIHREHDVVDYIRSQRLGALSNESFAAWLREKQKES